MTVALASLGTAALDPEQVERGVLAAAAGAVVTFSGRVRDHDDGRTVVLLDYSAHPSAEAVLHQVAATVAAEPEVLAVAVAHRLGPLQVGDVAIVASVSCAHRAQAFDACARLVDAVKHTVPIWKHQHFADGTQEWVGAC